MNCSSSNCVLGSGKRSWRKRCVVEREISKPYSM